MGIIIAATGSYLPPKIVTNDDLSSFLDTSDEWIKSRTGISSRHISTTDTTTTMGTGAARIALERSGLAPDEIDLVICVSVSPDACGPMMAATIKKELGIESAAAFDMNANCSGFVYGVTIASSLMECAGYRNAIVIGSDTMSQLVDWTDRSTCVLFGDAAGAVVLSQSDARGILAYTLDCKPDKDNVLCCNNVLMPTPFSGVSRSGADATLKMNGRGVMRFAVKAFSDTVKQVTHKAGVDIGDIKLIVPHQANLRILASAAKGIGISPDKIYVNIDRTANTSSATIPVALDWAHNEGRICDGDIVLLIAFGGGLSSGGVLLEWGGAQK